MATGHIDKSASSTSVSTSTYSVGVADLDQIEPILIEHAPGESNRLPWGSLKEVGDFPETVHISPNSKPGQFVLQTLFAEFTVQADKKIEQVLTASSGDKIHEKPLSKIIQRGEDAAFEQLLGSLGSVSENCLPSLLRVLFDWYDKQNPTDELGNLLHRHTTKPKGEKDLLCEKRDLAVDFLYCVVLIEVLKQLPYHPGHDEYITHVINQCFKHFKYKEGLKDSPLTVNLNIVAELYAEVMGVLAQSRFPAVKKRFMTELKELRGRDQSPTTTNNIIGLLMGMKFFRIKMHPIEDFMMCVQFLHDLGGYFLEVKDKEIKHALAGLFVEILLPVAAVVKNEVNVPVLKTFVEKMYPPTLDLCVTKKKHSLALLPTVTCLLCVSQKQYFLDKLPTFITQCLSRLRGDSKMARVALESLYRLVWVYVIRIKCESNTQTHSRLQSIINSLFPKAQKTIIVPKDAPLNIFVKIIQYIAYERLDFAMREVIYDLLSVGKQPIKVFSPERMSIGLRAFLFITDNRQQREGHPPMPLIKPTPYDQRGTLRKKTFIHKHMSEETAKTIGMVSYYHHVRKAFDAILRYLDKDVGRPLLMVKMDNINREPEDLITGERKPKIDLFRTCVMSIPRLLPEGMSMLELIELLSRLTLHMDDELGKLAVQSLQNMLTDLPQHRTDVIHGFVSFVHKEVSDSFPQQLADCNRRLGSLLGHWKTVVQATHSNSKGGGPELSAEDQSRCRATLHEVEGFALVMLCGCMQFHVRKQAVTILKEVRNLFTVLRLTGSPVGPGSLGGAGGGDPCVLDVMDMSCPRVIEKVLPHLPPADRVIALSCSSNDFQWLVERTSIIYLSGDYISGSYSLTYTAVDSGSSGSGGAGAAGTSGSVGGAGGGAGGGSAGTTESPWVECLSVFMHTDFVAGKCPTAISHTWPILYARLRDLEDHVGPNMSQTLSRTSSFLSRSSSQQGTLRRDAAPNASRTSYILSRGSQPVANKRDMYLSLWKHYVVMGCCVAPPSQPPTQPMPGGSMADQRSVSPNLNTSDDSGDKSSTLAALVRPPSPGATARELFKLHMMPFLRSDMTDIREMAVVGLGHVNPQAFRDLTEELVPVIKEAIDKKPVNRRKKRSDTLRLALARIFHFMAQNGVFASSYHDVVEFGRENLSPVFAEYIDGARQYLESDMDKEPQLLFEIRLHFSEFIRHLIRTTPVQRRHKFLKDELRVNLFNLFATWSGSYGHPFGGLEKRYSTIETYTELELSSLRSMAAVLCCGPAFSPPGLLNTSKIYQWLDKLLGTHNEKMYKLAQETIVLLLEFNPDCQHLLEWVIDRCYTGTVEVADGCFQALAKVYSHREYLICSRESMLTVTLLNTGCPRIAIHESAVQLLHVLYKRFILDETTHPADHDPQGTDSPLAGPSPGGDRIDKKQLQELLMTGPYSRTQLCLSETLARLHPDQTMAMFSEITVRLQTAIPPIRQSLLQLLLPWLHNLELVDPNLQLPPADPIQGVDDLHAPLEGEGWGSPEATEMVLNNLFYITAKFGDFHAKELEDIWAAMVMCWKNNLAVIVRYLIIVTGMAPGVMLPHAKRVVVYMGRARPERLVDEMMNELRTIESLTFLVERTQTPPFYRLLRKQQTVTSSSSDGEDSEAASSQDDLCSVLTDRTSVQSVHSKRLSHVESTLDPSKLGMPADTSPRTSSVTSLRSDTSTTSSMTGGGGAIGGAALRTAQEALEEDHDSSPHRRSDSPQPFPLPMPPYGGYYAPMSTLMPVDNDSMPNPPYQRCNLAVMLITDLIVDCEVVDWTAHLPLMLHIIFLGLDNARSLIHEHCKKLLINLLLMLSAHNDHYGIAKILLGSKGLHDHSATLTLPATPSPSSFMDGSYDSSSSPASVGACTPNSEDTMTPESVTSLVDVESHETTEQAARVLIEFIVTRKCQPLWSCEDITSKVHDIKSAEQLEHFLKYVLRIFKESLPKSYIEQRWAKEALILALNCSSRHYAGRSFQVFRALRVPLTSSDLSEILSRLEQTVAEQGEDMQGYVTEILLTLEAAVDNLDVEIKPFMKELFLSTPNLHQQQRGGAAAAGGGGGGGGGGAGGPGEIKKSSTTLTPMRQPPLSYHFRSTSYSVSHYVRRSNLASPPVLDVRALIEHGWLLRIHRKMVATAPPDCLIPKKQTRPVRRSPTVTGTPGRHHRVSSSGSSDTSESRRDTNLKRSTSAQSLKQLQDPLAHEDKVTILAQMFWIAVSMLEADFEYEFLLAVRLLNKILEHIQPDRPECREKLEKILKQINWECFPGVQNMLLKGFTSPETSRPTWALLSKLTRCVEAPVIVPQMPLEGQGFPINVIALLPYLVEHYEDPNESCTEAADRIAQMCGEQAHLDNLRTVMNLYSRGTFGKDSTQWTRCVVKYLYDAYSDLSDSMIGFLVEVLDKGPPSGKAAVLQILYCFTHFVDIAQCPSHTINSHLFRVVAKYVEFNQDGRVSREAMKILKLCVERSSSLTEAPSSFNTSFGSETAGLGPTLHNSFPQAQGPARNELPGRTMDFTFDLNQIPVIGHKRLDLPNPDLSCDKDRGSEKGSRSADSNATGDDDYVTNWAKPHLSQKRTRARLKKLLDYYDPVPSRKLPASSSVVFDPDGNSPNSTLQRKPSQKSSEEGSVPGTDPTSDTIGDGSSTTEALLEFRFLEDEESDTTWGLLSNVYLDHHGSGGTEDRHGGERGDRDSAGSRRRRHASSDDDTGGDAGADTDTDDETESVSPSNEDHHDLPSCATITVDPADPADLARTRHPSGSTRSVTHTDTEEEMTGDVSPASPPHLLCDSGPYMHLLSREIEDEWRAHVNQVMRDGSGGHAVSTFHLFSRLFQETRSKLADLCSEAKAFLHKPIQIEHISSQLSSMLELVKSRVECPFVFADVEALSLCDFTERNKIRFCYAEIEQAYDTYLRKRTESIECLNQLRLSVRHMALSETPGDYSDRKKLSLCQDLYGLHFQLLQLFEGYMKLVRKLTEKAQQVLDLSEEVATLKSDLEKMAAVAGDQSGAEGDESVTIDTNTMSEDEAEKLLMDFLTSRQYARALHYMRKLRPVFPEDVYGVHMLNNVEALLYVYCLRRSEAKPGVIVVTNTQYDLSDVHSQLMEIKSTLVQIDQSGRPLEPPELVMRISDSSSL